MGSIEAQVAAAWNTVLEMCEDRGWSTDRARAMGDEEVGVLAAEFVTFGVHINAGDRAVFHPSGPSIKKQAVFAAADSAARIVLVTRVKLSSATLKSLNADAINRGIEVQPFTLEELQFNVSRHDLQPKFALLTAAAEEDVLRNLGLTNRALLPAILASDPMARYLGLRKGQIVRVDRTNQTSGASVNYRSCV